MGACRIRDAAALASIPDSLASFVDRNSLTEQMALVYMIQHLFPLSVDVGNLIAGGVARREAVPGGEPSAACAPRQVRAVGPMA